MEAGLRNVPRSSCGAHAALRECELYMVTDRGNAEPSMSSLASTRPRASRLSRAFECVVKAFLERAPKRSRGCLAMSGSVVFAQHHARH